MTMVLKFLLVTHVVTGLIGVIAYYAVLIGLLKREVRLLPLRAWSRWGLVLLVVSWVTAAYYYVTYYGAAVKPVILAGPFPWAHTVGMEAKEHIFLFLPFLALVVTAALYWDGLTGEKGSNVKKSLTWLSGAIIILGTAVTLFGAAVSGAVR